MSRALKTAARAPPLRPQMYEHRVEVVLHALAAAATAQEKLTCFLLDQQGAEWQDLAYLVEAAGQDLRRASQWLGKCRDHVCSRRKQRR